MEEERDAAEQVKQELPILVILGNPPYNGFAGVAIAEERGLTEAYRTTKKAPAPRARASTTSTCASSAWPSGASWRRPAGGSSASSPTTPGWTACRSPGCASGILEVVRPDLDRLPERRQVQDRQADPDGETRPERLLDRAQPGGHPGRHGDRAAGAQGETTSRRTCECRYREFWGSARSVESWRSLQPATRSRALSAA